MPIALVVAARPYLKELRQALDQSRIQIVTAEFERSVPVAIEHQPDLILIASQPIPDVLQTCQRLLENGSTRNIPIFLISLEFSGIDNAPPVFRETAPQTRAGEFSHRSTPRRDKGKFPQDNDHSVVNSRRQTQLLSVLDLLCYAEAEIAELGIETSAALLGATIADVAQNLE
ncbi:hypothetical protein [Bradyrhizobium zhanjiangense]|uniref:Response regulatory domain-containing protein n=1 Tax=Bradyrhizobium zhanjiangense TaxID=1325107 RepID=A0ABY0D9D1_9BRAD|nr:hypothetical protein [Bradyrhizobium zhanjiangense]RXG86621.1 hypothetical protein EAS62_37055 [Bradyrhizobium zhanjiangense]